MARALRDDREVLDLNRAALYELAGEKDLVVVPGAGHLFEEPGRLDIVARLAARWFVRNLASLRTIRPEDGRAAPTRAGQL